MVALWKLTGGEYDEPESRCLLGNEEINLMKMKAARYGGGKATERERTGSPYTIPRIRAATPRANLPRQDFQSRMPKFDDETIILAPTTAEHEMLFSLSRDFLGSEH
jgi:hypothetical protein